MFIFFLGKCLPLNHLTVPKTSPRCDGKRERTMPDEVESDGRYFTNEEFEEVHVLPIIFAGCLTCLKEIERRVAKRMREQKHDLLKTATDDQIQRWTGFRSKAFFMAFYDNNIKPLVTNNCIQWLGDKERVRGQGKRGPARLLSPENEVLMAIKHCRNAFTHDQLGDDWNISQSLAFRIVTTWLAVFHECHKRQVYVPHAKSILSWKGRLNCFVTANGDPYPYADDVVIIVDATEFGVCTAPHATVRQVMHSKYKGKLTTKVLIGMGPDGSTYFVSEGYPGAATDTEVVEDCGILDLLKRLSKKRSTVGAIYMNGLYVS